MEAFQETMRAFLETQRSTMLAYLGHAEPAPAALRADHSPTLRRWMEGGEIPSATVPRVDAVPSSTSNGHTNGFHKAERGTRTVEAYAKSGVGVGEDRPEPPPEAASDTLPAEPPSPALGREAIAVRLVEIVRDRTGYPAEMLKLDLDLEADLGIDSIKRVEILGTLRETVDGLDSAADSSLMDDLARAKTLGAIADRVAATLERCRAVTPVETEPISAAGPQEDCKVGSVPPASPWVAGVEPRRGDAPGGSSVPGDMDHPDAGGLPSGLRPQPPRTTVQSSCVGPAEMTPASTVRRMILEAVDAPLAGGRRGLMAGGVVVVTDDGRGVAGALGKALEAEGHRVAIVGGDRVDFSSPGAVEAALDAVRATGPIAGIVHTLPLRVAEAPGLDPAAWSDRMGAEVKGLFLLARAASPDLDRAAKQGGACLVAATSLGGSFAATGAVPEAFFPGQGGIAGLVKTLAREWPEVRTRVVDFDRAVPPEQVAARLAAEALTDDGWPEVGYQRGRRLRLQAVPKPLDRSTPALSLAPGDPVLITGGARGITAAVAEELARRWRPRLLLVGSSPLPADSEDSATTGLTSPSELKAALHHQLRRSGRAVGASDLEQAYRTLLNERQIRATLRALRDAGSEVDYARADVRNVRVLYGALETWRRRFGDPVGLIHGAGVIHDKLLRDKTPESFDRVLGTKLDGALNLARLLRLESLRFAAFFSSIAGRFGNKGQSDYAAANDALNKLAVWLDRRMAGRVVSVNWGPWSGVGMVSDLEGHLGRRGLGMIPPDAGRTAMADELTFGRKGDVEVVVAAALGSLDEPLPAPSQPAGESR